MTREEAEALAEKRERGKSKHMSHKRWAAVHNSVKGWHTALVDDPVFAASVAKERARLAVMRGDMAGFLSAASDCLMAKVQAELAKPTTPGMREEEG